MNKAPDLDERFRQALDRLRPVAPWLFPLPLMFRTSLSKAEWLSLLKEETPASYWGKSPDLMRATSHISGDDVTIQMREFGSVMVFKGYISDETS